MNNKVHKQFLLCRNVTTSDEGQSASSDDCLSFVRIKTRSLCLTCKKTFASVWSLKRHTKTKHPDEDVPTKTFKYPCDMCSGARRFNEVRHLMYHMRKEHGVYTAPKKQHKCALCEARFQRKKAKEHYISEHSMDIEEEQKIFATFKAFKSWKEVVERETKSRYILLRGSGAIGPFKSHYFVCHRSGEYVPKGRGERHLKTQGSCKIDALCPARMKVIEKNDGTCILSFVKTHIGHSTELAHLFLSPLEKREIVKKITMNVPFESVLDEVRHSLLSSPELQRIHLLTRKDLHNLKKSIEFGSETVLHRVSTNNDCWYRKFFTDGTSCILPL